MSKQEFGYGLVVGALLFISYYFQTYGLKYTTASKNAFITTLYVIIVPFLHWLFNKVRPTRNNLIAGLSYSANGSEVETVIIDGKITMENRKILTMDEELVYKKVNEIITRMGLDKKEY